MARNAEREIEELREHVQPAWSSAREQRVWARLRSERLAEVGHARARVSVSWVVALTVTIAAVVAVALWLQAGPRGASEHPEVADDDALVAPEEREFIALPYGSKLRPREGARYELRAAGRDAIELALVSGRLDFEVTHDPGRQFRVRVDEVVVEVVGTVFGVERRADTVVVEVTRGTVRVEAPRRDPVLLEAGDRLELGIRVEAGAAPEPPEATADVDVDDDADVEHERDGAGRREARDTAWLGLAESGAHDQAWSALDGGGHVDRRDPEALMAAADVARLTGHPKAAVGWLDVVIDNHRHSPLAPLAAFSKGRLLLEHLGDPSRAATAFALARDLGPAGPLAQDALAREVEALAKASDEATARARATLYVERYPDGQRLRSVRRWGGLD